MDPESINPKIQMGQIHGSFHRFARRGAAGAHFRALGREGARERGTSDRREAHSFQGFPPVAAGSM